MRYQEKIREYFPKDREMVIEKVDQILEIINRGSLKEYDMCSRLEEDLKLHRMALRGSPVPFLDYDRGTDPHTYTEGGMR